MHNYEIAFMIESMMCSLGAIIIKILPEFVLLVHFGSHNYISSQLIPTVLHCIGRNIRQLHHF